MEGSGEGMKLKDIETEEYFKLIDGDYLRELSSITSHREVQTDFKVAYLILHFHISRNEEGEQERNILLGDLFISILTERLVSRDSELLRRIIHKISHCHSQRIVGRKVCYKKELLPLAREVAYAQEAV